MPQSSGHILTFGRPDGRASIQHSPPSTSASTGAAGPAALRAGDAIQLASALLLLRVLGDTVAFAAHDDRLKSAAKAQGLGVFP